MCQTGCAAPRFADPSTCSTSHPRENAALPGCTAPCYPALPRRSVVPMSSDNDLGQFLRAQRVRITSADVGLPRVGSRRATGLRREEVTVLAGVSADYYARLEQGRERAPSAQVMDAVCAALRLGIDSRNHAYRLARGHHPQGDQPPRCRAHLPVLSNSGRPRRPGPTTGGRHCPGRVTER